jgi:predicted permease
MGFFTNPTSFRNANFLSNLRLDRKSLASSSQSLFTVLKNQPLPPHTSHPDFAHLILLVFEAVLEVVCVSLPGYIVARQGMFDAEAQKFVANLNVALFTPCLIFNKLASQLTAEKLTELAIIPFIFIVQTFVSWASARVISRLCRFDKRASNFVTAMGVFGNSNSLPISLVISLSKTLKGLHWDKIPNDNDDEVAARGILYLLIFQQLGQLLRWSWGYNVLLAPPESYVDDNSEENSRLERGQGRYTDDPEDSPDRPLLEGRASVEEEETCNRRAPTSSSEFESGGATPINQRSNGSNFSSRSSSPGRSTKDAAGLVTTPTNGNILTHQHSDDEITAFPRVELRSTNDSVGSVKKALRQAKFTVGSYFEKVRSTIASYSTTVFDALPSPMQKGVTWACNMIARFFRGLWEFMNPPLWAMLIAVVVASTPVLQRAFYEPGSFVRNSVTRAIDQSGGVAVPLILVVLGANLARNTLPKDAMTANPEEKKIEKKLLIACLLSRMLIPTLIMAPLLALAAKYIPVSIVDDPIFVIVCFLLTGAPSALQLAQICQINNVYVGVMTKLLFQSYVVWILPSTLILVMLSLEVVEWAAI